MFSDVSDSDLDHSGSSGGTDGRSLQRTSHSESFDSLDHESGLMVLHNRRGLYDNLKYVLSLPELCDVTFLVGPGRVPVHGIRAIIATRSRPFYQLILSHQNTVRRKPRKSQMRKVVSSVSRLACVRSQMRTEDGGTCGKLSIPIDEFEPEVFQQLMTYIHCGSVTADAETTVGLLNAAHLYDMPDLRQACWDFALDCVARAQYLRPLFTGARAYSAFKMTRLLMNKMRPYSDGYPDLLTRSQTLSELSSDVLMDDETDSDPVS